MYITEHYTGELELHENIYTKDTDVSDSVVRVFKISEVFTRSSNFTKETVPARRRRFRCPDGELRTKEEMGKQDLKALNEKMKQVRSFRDN